MEGCIAEGLKEVGVCAGVIELDGGKECACKPDGEEPVELGVFEGTFELACEGFVVKGEVGAGNQHEDGDDDVNVGTVEGADAGAFDAEAGGGDGREGDGYGLVEG